MNGDLVRFVEYLDTVHDKPLYIAWTDDVHEAGETVWLSDYRFVVVDVDERMGQSRVLLEASA